MQTQGFICCDSTIFLSPPPLNNQHLLELSNSIKNEFEERIAILESDKQHLSELSNSIKNELGQKIVILESDKQHLSEFSNSIKNQSEQRIATLESDKQHLWELSSSIKNELGQKIVTLESDKQTLTEERDQLVKNTRDPGQVRPSDYDFMNFGSTKVWPITLQKFLEKDDYLKVKAKHAEYMQDWVAQRGDNLLINHYDYLVYSSNVVWEKALLEIIGDEDNDYDIDKIKTKYLEILEFVR